MMFFITFRVGSSVRCCPIQQRGLVMTIMELAAIPLWILGVSGATTGALALVLCAFADDSLFIPDLSRRKILIWGWSSLPARPRASCLLAGSACRKRAG